MYFVMEISGTGIKVTVSFGKLNTIIFKGLLQSSRFDPATHERGVSTLPLCYPVIYNKKS